jgi:hypothetical protein
MEPIFDRTPHPFGGGPVDPVVYDASVAALRQRTVNFAARRYADMMMVGGLDRATADRHFRLRAAVVPAGLDARPIGLTSSRKPPPPTPPVTSTSRRTRRTAA